MVKKIFLFLVMGIFFVSCAALPTTPSPAQAPQEIVVKVEATDPTKVTVEEGQKERVNKSMEVANRRADYPSCRSSQTTRHLSKSSQGCQWRMLPVCGTVLLSWRITQRSAT